MASGYPDWTRAFLMLGQHAGEYKLVAVDEQGRLYSLMRGEDGTGALKTVRLDADGQMIAILKGASGEYLGIDEDGYLTTVIKGEYANELRTVKLDGEGRLSAFVIDSVDAWGHLLGIGLSELAARLGSPITYQRSGQVVLLETFENGLARICLSGYGAGDGYELSPLGVASGGYCLKLSAGTAEDNSMGIYFWRQRQPLGKWGFGCKFSFDGHFGAVESYLPVCDGVNHYYMGWRLDDTVGKLYIYDHQGLWEEVADVFISTFDRTRFNQVKLIGDYTTGYYDRFLYNEMDIDCSAHQMYTTTGIDQQGMGLDFYLYNRTGATDVCYVDDLFVTVAEP